MTSRSVSHHDVIVVGARCAGAATARLLAAQGHDVLVLDRADLPADTLSTHGIARGGVVQLSRWGLLDEVLASGAPAVRTVTFAVGGERRTRRLKASAGVDLLVAPRRYVLDSILADAAVRAGATLRTATTVTDVLRDDTGRVIGVTARTRDGQRQTHLAHQVVGADGLRSTMAARLGASEQRGFSPDVSLFYAYVDQARWGGFEFHVSPGAFAGAFPTHDDQACVWLSRPTSLLDAVRRGGARRDAAFVDALDHAAPFLAAGVRAGRIVQGVRGLVAPPSYVRDAFGPGWALVGDAGYHRDPITGHGITDAFRDAELLADALDHALRYPPEEREALTTFQASRDESLAETYRLTAELTTFPDPARFIELQVELSAALDREAQTLASRPAPAGQHAVRSA